MGLSLTFDQTGAGIPAGQVDRARTDIVSTGPAGTRAYPVQITIGSVPVGATADLALLDEAPDSNPLLEQVDATHWTLTFDKDCYGPFRIRSRANRDGVVVESVVRRITIRSPRLSLQYPALSERTDPGATNVPTVPSVALTEMNEGGTNRSRVDFDRQMVDALEAMDEAVEGVETGSGFLVGGDLDGTVSDAEVIALRETTAAVRTRIALASIPDGKYVKRVGTELVGEDAVDDTARDSADDAASAASDAQDAADSATSAAAAVAAALIAHAGSGGAAHANAIAGGAAGFISGTNQQKLDGIEAGAQVTSAARVLAALAAAAASIAVNAQRITGLADPSAAQDAATKAYVDAVGQGFDVKASVRAVAASNITLSGTQTIDGVSVIAGDRVLCVGQSTASQNGIYVCAAGAWSRATDADASSEVTAGLFVWVTEGTTYADSGWVLTTNDAITLGSTSLTFQQFTGLGQVTAGTGLQKSGNTLSIEPTSAAAALTDLIAKSVLTAANQLLYGSGASTPAALTVAASRMVGRGASGNLAALTPSQSRDVMLVANPFDDAPDTACDDAVEFGVAGTTLAGLGFTVRNTTAGTNPTAAGYPDPWTQRATTTSFYEIAKKGLHWVQIRHSSNFQFHKALAATVAAGHHVFWANVAPPPVRLNASATAAAHVQTALILSKTSGGQIDGANYVQIGWLQSSGTLKLVLTVVIAGSPAFSVSRAVDGPCLPPVVGFWFNTSLNYVQGFAYDPLSRQPFLLETTVAAAGSFLTTLDRWGLNVSDDTSANDFPQATTAFKYMRHRKDGTSPWIADWL